MKLLIMFVLLVSGISNAQEREKGNCGFGPDDHCEVHIPIPKWVKPKVHMITLDFSEYYEREVKKGNAAVEKRMKEGGKIAVVACEAGDCQIDPDIGDGVGKVCDAGPTSSECITIPPGVEIRQYHEPFDKQTTDGIERITKVINAGTVAIESLNGFINAVGDTLEGVSTTVTRAVKGFFKSIFSFFTGSDDDKPASTQKK